MYALKDMKGMILKSWPLEWKRAQRGRHVGF